MVKRLSLEHRRKLSEASKLWWQLNRGSAFIEQRNEKIRKRLKGNPLVGACSRGIRTGPTKTCEFCGKEFYALPSATEKKFCSRDCYFGYVRKFGSKKKGHRTSVSIRRGDLIEKIGHCERCWFDDKRILVFHHIDGNNHHNKRENILLLCPNCHTLLHYEATGILKIKSLPPFAISKRDQVNEKQTNDTKITAGKEW